MIILGLTGSIAMGKSTVASMLERYGYQHHDADAVVHGLMAPGGVAVAMIAKRFPTVVQQSSVDRKALGAQVFGKPQALKDLEAILHPLVHQQTKAAMLRAHRSGKRGIVLDVPLLFEVKADRRCDWVISVDCSPSLQRARYMARPGADAKKLKGILASQLPQAVKRKRADFVLQTGQSRAGSLRDLLKILATIDSAEPKQRAWPINTYRNPSLKGMLHGARHT